MDDFYCKSMDEAVRELAKRKNNPASGSSIHRIERGPYGGFRVWSMDAQLYTDLLVSAPQAVAQRRKQEFVA